MKRTLFGIITIFLFLIPGTGTGQVITLGNASKFVLFTTTGAVTNSGTGFLTHLTGDIGSNSGSTTGFGNIDGSMHDGDGASNVAAADLLIAYNQLNTATPTFFPSSALGNGATLLPGVYSIAGPATLTGDLILNANGDPNAVFIFQINGALSTAANAKVKMINGGLACNVYWKTEGLVSIATGNSLKGTIVAHNAAISMSTLDSLEGRALSINGAVTMNSLLAYIPTGCGSAILTGPTAPTLGAVGIYALFSSIGPVTNSGAITYVTGDVGTNLGLTTGYNPLYVNGTIHPIPDVSTALAAPALANAYTQLNVLPVDITLLYPAQFGHSLVLTPHTYLLNAATSLTDTIYLNAQGNSNAVFVIKINGALSTSPGAVVKLINGTQGKNVYWKVEGAVSLANNVTFYGTVVANNGAIDLTAGAKFRGRALTTNGAITTNGDSVTADLLIPAGPITGDSTVCVGSSIPLFGATAGGTWSSSSVNATVNNLGIVTGITAGSATIRYIVTSGFGNDTAFKNITVTALPNAGTITGPTGVCIGSTILLANTTPGGIWSASNATATVIGGLVTGISSGIDTIRYTVTNLCGSAVATKIITISPTPTVNTVANQTVCNGALTAAVTYTGAVTGTTYSWTNNTTSIGLAASGTGNIPAFTAVNSTSSPITATITVTPSANGCTGIARTFTITVNPAANVAAVSSQTVCNGAQTTAVNYTGTVAGTTYSWTNNNTSIGLAASGTGNIPAFTAANSTIIPVIATITVTPTANGCPGTVQTFTITVNPSANVTTVANQIVCNGATTTAVAFTGTVSGTTYNWANNNTTIGLAASGTGNIAAFTALNSTTAPVVATITVTPTSTGCTGTARTFTITVNPTPNVAAVANQTVCNGVLTAPVTYSGTVSGTTYSWINNNASIGLSASGTGNIPAFTGTNSSIAPVTATITVTPAANGCTGTTRNFTITVNPAVNVATVANQTVCNGTFTTAVTYSGTTTGTTYSWTNNNASIGLASTGNGNISAFAATNTTSTPVVATITVTPTANGCTGPATSFTITVNPTANVTTIASQTVCNGMLTVPVTYTGTVIGTTYSWVNDNTTIGLTGAGNGNIAAFTALNSTNVPVVATITVTPTANGCTGIARSFTITVNRTANVAAIASQVICNGGLTAPVIYAGTVAGTTYSWTNSNTNIGLTGTGTGNIPAFTATNTGNTPIVATIIVTPAANGCTGATQSFTVTVNPTPTVVAIADQAICNGLLSTPVVYTGTVTGTTYNWANNTPSIGLATSGTGNIASFTAINTTSTPIVATITVTPTANGCTGITDTFTITVNNTPVSPVISLTTPASVCNKTFFRNFGAATLPPAGINYSWSTVNAAVSDTGKTQQYALINFKNTGTATVILTATQINTGCLSTASYDVNVTSNVADTPAQVIYFNHSFVCLQNNEEGYTWGYDDSYTLAPTLIEGELNQDYVNATPSLDTRNYWVMVSHNGCFQKTYYNKPAGAVMKPAPTEVRVFPNPADQQIEIAILTSVPGDIQMEIVSVQGRRLYRADVFNNKAKVDVSSFPSGIYMIVCYRNNEKISFTRFIKN